VRGGLSCFLKLDVECFRRQEFLQEPLGADKLTS